MTDLRVYFPIKRGFIVQREVARVRAVDGVSFDIYPGETLGLVGESGSGKTTVAKAVIQLTKADAGSVKFEGQELVGMSTPAMRPIRRKIGMVFQDPYASLDPRMMLGDIIADLVVGAEGVSMVRKNHIVRTGLAGLEEPALIIRMADADDRRGRKVSDLSAILRDSGPTW